MAFTVRLTDGARDDFDALSQKHRKQVQKKIDLLLESAEPPGAKKLQGHDNLWRLKTGFRALYRWCIGNR